MRIIHGTGRTTRMNRRLLPAQLVRTLARESLDGGKLRNAREKRIFRRKPRRDVDEESLDKHITVMNWVPYNFYWLLKKLIGY